MRTHKKKSLNFQIDVKFVHLLEFYCVKYTTHFVKKNLHISMVCNLKGNDEKKSFQEI